ncbi:MAG: hypothetical protein ACLVC5_09090 [Clostridia bacterium]
MSKGNTLKYRQEVRRLQEAYKDRIDIRLGVEMDYYGEKEIILTILSSVLFIPLKRTASCCRWTIRRRSWNKM